MANLHGVGGIGTPPRDDEEARGVPHTSPLVRSIVIIAVTVLIAAIIALGFGYILGERGS
jgi:LPS O-antigen subunit length determinant protein (WzzB/FepE family)